MFISKHGHLSRSFTGGHKLPESSSSLPLNPIVMTTTRRQPCLSPMPQVNPLRKPRIRIGCVYQVPAPPPQSPSPRPTSLSKHALANAAARSTPLVNPATLHTFHTLPSFTHLRSLVKIFHRASPRHRYHCCLLALVVRPPPIPNALHKFTLPHP